MVWDGSGYTDCYLNPELPGYDDLDSGIYKYTVQYIIKSQIAEEYAFNFIVDNDRPDMGVVSPEEDGAYDTLMPISLYVTDEEAGVAEDSVMVRVYEQGVSIFGWSWCGVDGCDDSGWMTLTAQDNNLYSMMFNFSEYDINQEGWFTVEAYACDNLYDPCEDSSCNDGLGFLLDTRNTHHCVPIVDGVAEERPECNDGWDNDFDGDIDYDDDIGCENLEDDIETNEELD